MNDEPMPIVRAGAPAPDPPSADQAPQAAAPPTELLGWFLLILYLLFVAHTIWTVSTCNGMFCELRLVLPALPWSGVLFVFEGAGEGFAYGFTALSYALNAWLIYRLGCWLGRLGA